MDLIFAGDSSVCDTSSATWLFEDEDDDEYEDESDEDELRTSRS